MFGIGPILGSAFAAVVAWLTTVVTKKVAIAAAYTAFLLAGWVGFQTALYAIWVGVGFVMPASLVAPLELVSYLLPDNTFVCINALVAAKIGRWLWDRQREWAAVVAAA